MDTGGGFDANDGDHVLQWLKMESYTWTGTITTHESELIAKLAEKVAQGPSVVVSSELLKTR